jgi:RNA polymerase sigma-70 factor, ECF subfamily
MKYTIQDWKNININMTTFEFQHRLINLQESLMGFAYRLTADRDDAKDLVQETNLRSLKYYDKFVHKANFRAWTFTIMKNTFINNHRHTLLQNIYRDQTKELFYINQREYIESDDIFSASEITQKIEKLKETLRIPFKMFIDGYKYKEIADELGLNIGTVKSRIFFSRKKLRYQLNTSKKWQGNT